MTSAINGTGQSPAAIAISNQGPIVRAGDTHATLPLHDHVVFPGPLPDSICSPDYLLWAGRDLRSPLKRLDTLLRQEKKEIRIDAAGNPHVRQRSLIRNIGCGRSTDGIDAYRLSKSSFSSDGLTVLALCPNRVAIVQAPDESIHVVTGGGFVSYGNYVVLGVINLTRMQTTMRGVRSERFQAGVMASMLVGIAPGFVAMARNNRENVLLEAGYHVLHGPSWSLLAGFSLSSCQQMVQYDITRDSIQLHASVCVRWRLVDPLRFAGAGYEDAFAFLQADIRAHLDRLFAARDGEAIFRERRRASVDFAPLVQQNDLACVPVRIANDPAQTTFSLGALLSWLHTKGGVQAPHPKTRNAFILAHITPDRVAQTIIEQLYGAQMS